MKKNRQILTFWTQFVELKSNQLYLDYFKQDSHIQQCFVTAFTVLLSAFILFIRKQFYSNEYYLTILTLLLHCAYTFILLRKPHLNKMNYHLAIQWVQCFDIMSIQESPKKENEWLFLVKTAFVLVLLQLVQQVQNSSWQSSLTKTTVIVTSSTVISFAKFVILIALISLFQAFVLIPLVLNESRMKKLWNNWTEQKKKFKSMDLLLFNLPMPLIIVDQQFKVIMQNQLSQKVLPQDVDFVNKKYSTKDIFLDNILLKPKDITLLKEIVQKVLKSGELSILQTAFFGCSSTCTLYLQKVFYNRTNCVIITCSENSDDQTIEYNNQYQAKQLKLLSKLSDSMSIDDRYATQLSMLRIMAVSTPFSIYPYSQQCNIDFNLHNYMNFFLDIISLTYLENTDLSMKQHNDVPLVVCADVLRLHNSLMQLVLFVQKQYELKQRMIESRASLDTPLSQKHIEFKKDNRQNLNFLFVVVENQVIEGRQLDWNQSVVRIGFEYNFIQPISEQQMIFQKTESTVADGANKQFNYFRDMVKLALGADIQVFEKQEILKIDILLPIHQTKNCSSQMFGDYETKGQTVEGSRNNIQWSKLEDPSLNHRLQQQQPTSMKLIKSDKNIRRQNFRCNVIQEEASRQLSEENCSILKNKIEELNSNSGVIQFSYIPQIESAMKMSEEEKKTSSHKKVKDNLFDISSICSLSPIPILRPPINNLDPQNYDMQENISKHMHFITKGVSKTLENILQEIISYKGKRVNVHFRSNKKQEQRSFEASPASSLKDSSKGNSVPVQLQAQNFMEGNYDFPEHQDNQQFICQTATFLPGAQDQPQKTQQPELSKGVQKQLKTKYSSFLNNLREGTSPDRQMPAQQQKSNHLNQYLNRPSQESEKQIKNVSQKNIIINEMGFSFKDIKNELETPKLKNTDSQLSIESSPKGLQYYCADVLEEDNTSNMSNISKVPEKKWKYCPILTIMLVDDFVFVLNGVQSMKLEVERKIEPFSKGIDAFAKFKQHLNDGFLYHFIMVDFKMPEKNWDGYKLVSEIRKFEQDEGAPPAYIIGLDNDLDDKKLADAIERGFDMAVEKPLNPLVIGGWITKRMQELGDQ